MASHLPSEQRLADHECWRLLRSVEFGRLGLIVDGQPEIIPVNFTVDTGTVVFRTATGTKLDALTARPAVAFEVDGIEQDMAWSVLVKGRAEPIRRLHELVETVTLPVHPWHPLGVVLDEVARTL